MKRCPECRRDYFDDTLLYCLDDGTRLLEGPASHEPGKEPLNGDPVAEGPTVLLPENLTKGLSDQSGTGVRLEPPPGESSKVVKRNSRAFYTAGAAVFLLVVGAGILYWWLGSRVGVIDSVAVLPFENASGDPELDYLSDGVSEGIIDRLSQLQQLKVVARSSSFRYRGEHDAREVGNALGVGALITGRVVPRGDSVSIRVELIDARDNKHLWGDTFVRNLTDVHVLQNDISRQIVDILRIRLSGTQADQIAGSGTADPEAYELFLRGRFFLHKAGAPENFRRAAEYLEKAIAVDPSFALAYAMLADTYGFGGFPPGLTRAERESLLERTVQRAVDLDPQLADAHHSMANFLRRNWRWEQAKASSLRAIELNPNLAQALNGYAFHLTLMSEHEAALEYALRARELDPISLVINTNLGNIYMRMERYDEAVSILQKTVDFGEPAMFARRSLGSIYLIRGMYDQALAQYEEPFRISGNSPAMKAMIGFLHAKAGRRQLAENMAAEIIAGTGNPPELALLLDSLGRRDEAFEVLNQNLRDRVPGLPLVTTEPIFKTLANDDRYRSLLVNMGLPVDRRV